MRQLVGRLVSRVSRESAEDRDSPIVLPQREKTPRPFPRPCKSRIRERARASNDRVSDLQGRMPPPLWSGAS